MNQGINLLITNIKKCILITVNNVNFLNIFMSVWVFCLVLSSYFTRFRGSKIDTSYILGNAFDMFFSVVVDSI